MSRYQTFTYAELQQELEAIDASIEYNKQSINRLIASRTKLQNELATRGAAQPKEIRTTPKKYVLDSNGVRHVAAIGRVAPASYIDQRNKVIVDSCPYCGEKHTHLTIGAALGDIMYGVRIAECFKGKYMIVDSTASVSFVEESE